MTPQSPKPSMHIWIPSPGDISGGLLGGFGVLIIIINGGIECGNSFSSQKAINRALYYENFISAFDLPKEHPSTMTCSNMHQFDPSSSSFVPTYWDRDWVTDNSWKLVPYQTGSTRRCHMKSVLSISPVCPVCDEPLKNTFSPDYSHHRS